ncbi:inosine/xanthosine triphosphatase [candidate division KSB1 bacterium]|nr:inosine/xanthosine triphosphatase [candidate division KSB1 bacterium]
MLKVLIASNNPVKIDAAKDAFGHYFNDFEIVPLSVESGVSDQPVNDETYEGARNRVYRLREINNERELGADYFVGIEGGIVNHFNKWFAFGVICIMHNSGKMGLGTSIHFEIPSSIVDSLLQGEELGLLMDQLSGDYNTKRKGGAIGYFTKGVITRRDIYVQGLIAALVPFLNGEFDC